MPFAHLHVHTEYSLLDGACRIGKMMNIVKDMGQNAVAITDHGSMYGVVDFYKEAKAHGINPVIGCECYVARRTRHDRVHELDSSSHHLVLLCENNTGYHNLCQMLSIANVEGFYVKPRIDWELLEQYHEGLICLSACQKGEVAQLILDNDMDKARDTALRYQKLFGEGRYFLEIMDHDLPDQKIVQRGATLLAQETGIGLVCTNDVHYLTREDAYAQDVLMCIQTAQTVDAADRMRFGTEEFYLKSEAEMAERFPKEALENTQKIADMCKVEFEFGKYHLPKFALPEGRKSAPAYLKKLCEEGYKSRYPGDPPGYRDRLKYELDMIRRMGFDDYFLIVGDFVNYAKGQGIPVGPGRGSGAGSMAGYCLGITDVDPMKYNLVFERFLNPERISMPDFDIDFCVSRRGEVIDYVARKYGAAHVAQIITFGTMAARAVVRDVARAMSLTYAEADVVAKAIPFAVGMTLDAALDSSPALKEMYDSDPKVKKLIDVAKLLEGMPRHAGTHAAGVVITARPVSEYVPLARNDEQIVTQFPMNTLEELGLLKMDFLGLRNLTVLKRAEEMVRKQTPDFTGEFPEDDPGVFKMLSQGKTSGVFQLESAGMTGVCTRLQPQSIEDITAVVALFRPGPMDSIPRFIESKHHPEKTTYKHPLLQPILDVTYGCIVYQEQVLEILRQLAGFTLGHADMVRRAMSKKKMSALAAEKAAFLKGCAEKGIPDATAKSIFDEIMDFANYAFNKAHAVCYAIIAYRTAWYKCHHPREYMAALISSVQGDTGRVQAYITECTESGITVLPPDVKESERGFTVTENGIRFGLGAIKNVGYGLIDALCAEREREMFADFEDFCRRMAGHDMNRRALDSLIKCGAFDSMGHTRRALCEAAEGLLDDITGGRKSTIEGQVDMFSLSPEVGSRPVFAIPDLPEWPVRERLGMERELTGLYLSGHPMDEYAVILRKLRTTSVYTMLEGLDEGRVRDGEKVRLAGTLSGVKTKTTRNQSLMAYATLEDKSGAVELLLFSGVLTRAGGHVKDDHAVLIDGKISVRDDRPAQILVDDVRPIAELGDPIPEPEKEPAAGQKLFIRLPEEDGAFAKRVLPSLNFFPGRTPTVLVYADTGKRLIGECDPDHRLLDGLTALLGAENVVLRGQV